LDFVDSLKMKASVIIGVIHMTAGLFLALLNHIYWGDWKKITFEWTMQVTFLMTTFGFMDFLIIWKWFGNWNYYLMPTWLQNNVQNDTFYQSPRILNVMIGMYMTPWTVGPGLYTGIPFQWEVQCVLMVIAIGAVPIMLCVRPAIIIFQFKQGHDVHDAHHGGEGEPFDVGEFCITQAIHTIEFVLGCISNTASYLRLWALSLAHSELSVVFYEMTIALALRFNKIFYFTGYIVSFAVWAGATIGVLCVMEALSAFLHALRLHWVEHQNKFYAGDGYKFLPFCYTRLLVSPDPFAKDDD